MHVDAYRLATAVELEDLDLDWEHAIVVVEWGAGKLDEAGDRIELAIERPIGGDPLADDSPRHVRITGVGERWAARDETSQAREGIWYHSDTIAHGDDTAAHGRAGARAGASGGSRRRSKQEATVRAIMDAASRQVRRERFDEFSTTGRDSGTTALARASRRVTEYSGASKTFCRSAGDLGRSSGP